MKIKKKQDLVKKWFIKLQNIICKNIELLEKEYGSNKKFKKNKWKYGEFRIIKGEVIEKGGVAFSNVVGKFPKEFAKKIPGTKGNNKFWSSGVSVVLHPKNPKIPALHFNTRFICTQKNWFGTTGFSKKEENLIKKFAKKIPILRAGNMSLGINLLMYLTEIASKSLGNNFLSKVFEIHHKHKKDHPSGTALMLGKGIAVGKNKDFYKLMEIGRASCRERV